MRRRMDSAGIFPNRKAITCLSSVVLAEQTDEWAKGRREVLTRSQNHTTANPT